MKLKYILVTAVIGVGFATALMQLQRYKSKTVNQNVTHKNQTNDPQQQVFSDIPIRIILDRTDSRPFDDGYRAIFFLLEEKYFTKDQLINLFTAISDRYEHPKDLTAYAYSNEE